MRVSPVMNYAMRSTVKNRKVDAPVAKEMRRVNAPETPPSFKGSEVGKVVGFLAGAALVCVAAPGLAAIGLAGLGAAPGMMIGAAIDEKIDEANEKKDK